jgi:hypothetical protein
MSSSYLKEHEAKIAAEVSGARQRKPSAKVAEASGESNKDNDNAAQTTKPTTEDSLTHLGP